MHARTHATADSSLLVPPQVEYLIGVQTRRMCLGTTEPQCAAEAGCAWCPLTGKCFKPKVMKPCSTPSVLDPFRESTYLYEDLVANGDFGVMMEVGKTADRVGVPDQTWDSRNNPSFKEEHLVKDNYRGLIDRMSRHNKNWLQGTNQNVKRLYGNVKLDENKTIVFAETFNTRFVNRAPVSAITQSERFVSAGFTQDEFKEADERFLLKLEEVLENYDKDEVEFPDLEIAFYPNNAVSDGPAPNTRSHACCRFRCGEHASPTACRVLILAAYPYEEGCQRLDDGPNHDRRIRHDDIRCPFSNAAWGRGQSQHPCICGILGRGAEHWDCHGIPGYVWDGVL